MYLQSVRAVASLGIGRHSVDPEPGVSQNGRYAKSATGYDTTIDTGDPLGRQVIGLTIWRMRNKTTIGGNHSPPGQAIDPTKHSTDRSCCTGVAGLCRQFAIGQHITGFGGL